MPAGVSCLTVLDPLGGEGMKHDGPFVPNKSIDL
jgi:hypothetical protein